MIYEEQTFLWESLDYFDDWTDPRSLPDEVEQLERDRIASALDRHNGNKSHAAKELGIGRTNLIAKLKKYSIII